MTTTDKRRENDTVSVENHNASSLSFSRPRRKAPTVFSPYTEPKTTTTDMNDFKYIVRSTHGQLSEYHSAAVSAEAEGFVALADSIVRLVFVQLCATFALVDALLPLCKVAMLIMRFLLNNACGIAQARGDPSKSALRLLLFACQTACLYAITSYGVVRVFCPILSAILQVVENCLKPFGR